VFSPELANQPPAHGDVNVSVMINNEAKIPVCGSFSLGFNSVDDNIQAGKMLEINEEINKGERISGYIEKLYSRDPATPTEIKLHFKCESDEEFENEK
ncbi:MAG: hypothetical protein WC223_12490, partial [Bacteroidales bacterium]